MAKATALEIASALRRLEFAHEIESVAAWYDEVIDLITRHVSGQRWIPREHIDELVASKPDARLLQRLQRAGCDATLSADEREAVDFLGSDLRRLTAATNEKIMAGELETRRAFFDTIEKTPLTEEQSRAVVCFDNRVRLLAAAGSGKTSVMVARAAYAVSRGFVAPERILLLAFNNRAAKELQDRVRARFAAAGIEHAGVNASTFHAFGLGVVGQAAKKKPRLASWLGDDGNGDRMVLQIMDELSDRSEGFRYAWDLFRLLFAPAPVELAENQPDSHDRATDTNGYATFGGDVVRSHSERLIADFLYLNGVNYVYERPYSVDVADATHSQYRPDFYYPDLDVWHEHWAIDRSGKPPAEFVGYAEGMRWKRRVHNQHGTTLIESSWGEVMFGDGLTKLAADLTSRGLTLDWNPERAPKSQWVRKTRHEDVARLIRTFMSHMKSNSWTAARLDQRLDGDQRHLAGSRTTLFLRLFWEILNEWEARLRAENSVDFDDMLVRAAHHLKAGHVDCDYDLILVDEFQDASRGRARLVRALVSKPNRYLLAVGDDWQSINRFAGADLSVMTEFDDWFGGGPQLALTTTFRCTQAICDASRTFVTKNSAQFPKAMRSARGDRGRSVEVVRSDDVPTALSAYAEELSAAIGDGRLPSENPGRASVYVLGRYNFERRDLPRRWPANLDVQFQTIHRSKGLEADYVVVPGMKTGRYGFPSNIADDPVLALAMPVPEPFRHAEERRLFYVALTRARYHVTLITPRATVSPFALELVKDGSAHMADDAGEAIQVCRCGNGFMVERKGPYGAFLGCSTFPMCRCTQKLLVN